MKLNMTFRLLVLAYSVLFAAASSDMNMMSNAFMQNQCNAKMDVSKIEEALTKENQSVLPDDSCIINMNNYTIPTYNLSEVKEEIVNGNGFYIMKNVFSPEDVKLAKLRVEYLTKHARIQTNVDNSKSGAHNSYGGKKSGIVWRLLGKGKIFEKIALHPTLVEVTRELLGPKSQISSYMSNSVAPDSEGQAPHIDYPYYDGFFPTSEQNSPRPLLSLGIMIMLSEFTKENGGTAARPGSQRNPTYPHDREDFFRNSVQFEGQPGDVAFFAASIQHCAMPNRSPNFRRGIVQSMIPVYLKPYQDINIGPQKEHIQPEMRSLLALDHPYPMKH